MCWLPPARACRRGKTLHQQNPPVLNWRCPLMQVGLYNDRKMVVVVVVVVVDVVYQVSVTDNICYTDYD